MINGHLSKLQDYKGINIGLDQAIEYVMNNDLNKLPFGFHKINDLVTINKIKYIGGLEEDGHPEEHRHHLDMQMLLENEEYCLYGYLENINQDDVFQEYDEEKDVVLFNAKVQNKIYLNTQNFIIYFPDDVHLPSRKINDNEIVKVVIKVKID